eukprot:TRINITY_DN11875_c0_g1_i1.p1 TRINITY_DN11875_c0_g1~~TRINITY_DN11875_c0_g1_i1.p1  ORF type:complete len:210 (-),score=13.86 TRINITY_DN11875_c0_g1_i1:162-791(-)
MEQNSTDSSDGDGWTQGDGAGPVVPYDGPLFCVFKGVGDALAGSVMGSVFGLGTGIYKKAGFKGAFLEAGNSARTFALLSGVHSLVSCSLKRIRGKEDAINAGIAGCATGLALSTPGSPQALLQSCASFGIFSFLYEALIQTRPRPAVAATLKNPPLSRTSYQTAATSLPVLPPFCLPPPLLAIQGSVQRLAADIQVRCNSGRRDSGSF